MKLSKKQKQEIKRIVNAVFNYDPAHTDLEGIIAEFHLCLEDISMDIALKEDPFDSIIYTLTLRELIDMHREYEAITRGKVYTPKQIANMHKFGHKFATGPTGI